MIEHATKDAEAIRTFLESRDSFWHWDNHKHVAQLTSGKLSDFFANCSPIFTDTHFQRNVGQMLARCLSGVEDLPFESRWVVGSAMGAIGLSQALAHVIGASSAFTEPEGDVMVLKRFRLEGKVPHVVVCEDVMSTGSTTVKTIAAIVAKHPDARFYPEIPVVVDRRPNKQEELEVGKLRFKVRGILSVTPRVWDRVEDLPDDMKDCVPLRPKGSWSKLKEKRNA